MDDEAASAFTGIKTRKIGSDNNSENKTDRSQRRSRKDVTCYNCGGKGHFVRECRKKKKNIQEGNGSQSSDYAFVVITPNQKRVSRAEPEIISVDQIKKLFEIDIKDIWINDSGASSHVTHRREWFSSYRPVSGERVLLGDEGQCDVIGVGSVVVEKHVSGVWSEATLENVLHVPAVKRNLFWLVRVQVKVPR